MACCLLTPSSVTVYCNCHRHQHFRSHSDNSVGMSHMPLAQNFLLKVALISDSLDGAPSSPTRFHFLSSPLAREPSHGRVFRLSFHSRTLRGHLIFIHSHLGAFIPFTGWSLLWLFFKKKLGINLYLEQRKKSFKRLNLCCYYCCEFV